MSRPAALLKLEEDAYYAVLRALAVNDLDWVTPTYRQVPTVHLFEYNELSRRHVIKLSFWRLFSSRRRFMASKGRSSVIKSIEAECRTRKSYWQIFERFWISPMTSISSFWRKWLKTSWWLGLRRRTTLLQRDQQFWTTICRHQGSIQAIQIESQTDHCREAWKLHHLLLQHPDNQGMNLNAG